MKRITYICDRCGKEFSKDYEYTQKRTVTIAKYGNGKMGEQYDLCPKCYIEFCGWWSQDNVTFKDVDHVICQLDCDKCVDSVTLVREIRDLFEKKGE